MTTKISLVWFRNDLRLDDNPAWAAAIARGNPVLPIYLWSPSEEGTWIPGAASRVWLHGALDSLNRQLQKLGGQLILRQGNSAQVLLTQLIRELSESYEVDAIFWNRRYEPAIIERDKSIKEFFTQKNLTVQGFNSLLLVEPWEVKNKTGQPYKVFTPFWNSILSQNQIPKSKAFNQKQLAFPTTWPKSELLANLKLKPSISWDAGIAQAWQPGFDLQDFIENHLAQYPTNRDIPNLAGTSRLSPYLHFGQIGPRQVWHAVQKFTGLHKQTGLAYGAEIYLKELGWREFAHHLLYHFPQTAEQPLRSEFAHFPWQKNQKLLVAWQKGQTGYPLVDAGMRELRASGWMHNRVRMLAASFLVKHLRINWSEGARWFWDTLVDADLASNTLGWQWSAGCGADAAPYFRIFNPTLQQQKFDPQFLYIKKWVPEFNTPDYPKPIVEHVQARDEALAAFKSLAVR